MVALSATYLFVLVPEPSPDTINTLNIWRSNKMAILTACSRPVTVFDANSQKHRKWYAEYKRSGNWGNCPVRFQVNDSTGTLLDIDYYFSDEKDATLFMLKWSQ
jgi:hypothetical protein